MSWLAAVLGVWALAVGVRFLFANDSGKPSAISSAEVQGTSPAPRINLPVQWWPWRLRLWAVTILAGLTVTVALWLVDPLFAGLTTILLTGLAVTLIIVGWANPRRGLRRMMVRITWPSVARSCGLAVLEDRRLVGDSESVRLEELPTLWGGRMVSPTAVTYRLRPPRGGTVAQVAERSEALAAALRVHQVQVTRTKADLGELTILLRPLPVVSPRSLDIDRPAPAPGPTGSIMMEVGIHAHGGPLTIPLLPAGGAGPHMLYAGTPGSGKSGWLDAIIDALAPLENVALVGIDPALVTFARWEDRFSAIATSPRERVALLSWLVDEMDLRLRFMAKATPKLTSITEGTPTCPIIVLILDELADLDDPAMSLLATLLAMARKVGIVVISATQHPHHSILPTTMRGNYGRRACGHVLEVDQAKSVLGVAAPGGLSPLDIGPTNPGVAVLLGYGPVPFMARAYFIDTHRAELVSASTAHLAPYLDGLHELLAAAATHRGKWATVTPMHGPREGAA